MLLVCYILLYLVVTYCLSRSVVLVCHTCFGLLYLEQGGSRHFGAIAIVAIGKLRLVTTSSRFSLDLESNKKEVGIAPPALAQTIMYIG